MEFRTEFKSKEDLKNYINEIKSISFEDETNQQAIKLIINSIYGAFANQYFHFYNIAIAESITLQGQDAIKYTEVMIEKYFKDFWHKDKELHAKLGISQEVKPLKFPVWVYTDTDSGYITFQECIESCGWKEEYKNFAMLINQHRLSEYINKSLTAYANKRNTENYLDFELETFANNAIWVAKKKYVQNIVWKDGKDYDNLSYIKVTGLEIIQSSTPVFCRKQLSELVKYLFSKDEIKIEDLIKELKEIKRLFKLANIEEISLNRSIGDYQKFVLNDTKELELNKGCPIHVRAAGYHNYLLNSNPNYKKKYQLLRSGDKVRWYYANDKFNNNFAYAPGAFPYEFAPEIDYEKTFEMSILQPLNRILTPTGLPELDHNLVYTVALF